jgi:hypothetical protein
VFVIAINHRNAGSDDASAKRIIQERQDTESSGGGVLANATGVGERPRQGSRCNGGRNVQLEGTGPRRTLTTAVKRAMWPTPNAANASNDVKLNCSGDGRKRPNKLGWAVSKTMWPTPTGTEERQGFQNGNNGKKGTQKSLTTVVQGGPSSQIGGQLNPKWVSWLMGFPVDWCDLPGELQMESQTGSTSLDASETQSSRKSRK